MKTHLIASLAVLALSTPAFAAGDAAAGEKEFKKCKTCHAIVDADGTVIYKGGKVGPDLWNIVGSKIAAVEGFKYGKGLLSVAEANPDMVWDEASLVEYMTGPQDWIDAHGGEGKTKMTHKQKKAQEDLAAYLASVSPDAPAAE